MSPTWLVFGLTSRMHRRQDHLRMDGFTYNSQVCGVTFCLYTDEDVSVQVYICMLSETRVQPHEWWFWELVFHHQCIEDSCYVYIKKDPHLTHQLPLSLFLFKFFKGDRAGDDCTSPKWSYLVAKLVPWILPWSILSFSLCMDTFVDKCWYIYIYIFFHCFLDLMKDPYTWKDILNSWCKYICIYRYVPGLTTIPAHYPLASHQLWGWSKGWCQARGSFSC